MYAKHVFDGVDNLFQIAFVKVADDVACVAACKAILEAFQYLLDVGDKRTFKVVAIVAFEVNFRITNDNYFHFYLLLRFILNILLQ